MFFSVPLLSSIISDSVIKIAQAVISFFSCSCSILGVSHIVACCCFPCDWVNLQLELMCFIVCLEKVVECGVRTAV